MRTIRHAETRCPHCGYKLDASSGIEDLTTPSAGDLSVCIGCAEVLQFDRQLKLQAIAPADLTRMLLQQPDLAEAIALGRKAVLEIQRQEERDRTDA